LGVIAQEIQDVLPKAVKTSTQLGFDDLLSVNLDRLYMILLGAVQKVMAKVEALEAHVAALKTPAA
jgi:hypothetical protein